MKKNEGATNDIAGYVHSKLYLVNLLNGTKYAKLYDAKMGINKDMAGIIDRLSHSQLNHLIEKIESLL